MVNAKLFPTENWPRLEAFRYFSSVSDPFYSICFNIDVTELKHYTKAYGLSFYYAMTKLVTDAVNAVPAFRLTLRNGQLYELDRRIPSFTDRRKGEEAFYIVTMDASMPLDDFCAEAKRRSTSQNGFLNAEEESDTLIYISCTPTLELTALTNERDFDRDDCIPRIAWGKYFERDGRLVMGLSLEITHRLIDGYHIAEFARILEDNINALEITDSNE